MQILSNRLPGVSLRAAALAATAIALIALLAIGAPGVSAHARYDHSTPGDEEVVAAEPTAVDVFFAEEVARGDGLPTLVVVSDDGDTVGTGVLDDNDRTHISAALDAGLENGRYTVIWHTVSADDGEEAEGAFHFYIGEKTEPSGAATGSPGTSATAGASATPIATAAPVTKDDSSGVSVVVLIIGIIAGAVVGGGAGYFAGRQGKS
ncbi:MAG: copper resistance CopC family protein [Chloroflexota bacterium]